MQSGGMFSRFTQGLGLSKPSKDLSRSSQPTSATSEGRRPPVGGGRHEDDEDQFPATHTQREQPAQVQEGAGSTKVGASQPTSEFSEIQPASSSEDATPQTVFAAPYKQTAIAKLMTETKGPSTTVPSTHEGDSSQTTRTAASMQQEPQASELAQSLPQGIQSGGAPVTSERVQSVSGYDNSSEAAPVQGQNMNTGGFRSSSGVPSEDELAQLYTNEVGTAQGAAGPRGQADTQTGDLPEDMKIGFSGKGSGIFGSFATPAARPARASATGQTGTAMQSQGSIPSQMQLPEGEEFRSYHQPEGVAATEAAPFTAPPQGEATKHLEAQPATRSQADHLTASPSELTAHHQLDVPHQFSAPQPDIPFTHYASSQQAFIPHTNMSLESSVVSEPHASCQQDNLSQSMLIDNRDANFEHLASPQQGFAPEREVASERQDLPQHTPTPLQFDIPQEFNFSQHDYTPAPRLFPPPQQDSPPIEPATAPVSDVGSQQLTQNVGDSGSYAQDVPTNPGQDAIFEGQQESETVPTGAQSYQPEESTQPIAAEQGRKAAGQGTWALAQGSEQFPATPDRLNRAPQPASPEDIQGMGSAPHGSAQPSVGAVTRQTEYNPPVSTQPTLEQEPPLSGNRGFSDIPNYPRENPLFDEEQQQQQQQDVEPEEAAAEAVFHTNPEFDGNATGQQTFGSPMIPNRGSVQQQSFNSPAYTEERFMPQTQVQDSGYEQHSNSDGIPPAFDQDQHRYGHPYESSEMYTALSGSKPIPSEVVTASNNAVEQEVLVNSAAQPEANTTVSNTAQDGRVSDLEEFEQSGHGVGHMTNVPQLGGLREEGVPEMAVTAQPEVYESAAFEQEVAEPVRPEQETVMMVDEPTVQEAELAATYHGPQIVSRDAELTALPPSAAWGPSSGVSSYLAPSRATPYVPPTQVQETVAVEQPVMESETIMVDQDPPIDPSVEPSLPVSTHVGTGMLTSTPQLSDTPVLGSGPTTEILPVQETQGIPLPTPMTREEITSYRPAQDPEIDPSQGQMPVQVPLDTAVQAPVAPRPPVMSSQEIAAYRSAEDPAYDPVQRRGWWDVDMTQGGGTILPTTTRAPAPRRGGRTTVRGAGRTSTPALTGDHILPGGDPSQATHFGSIVSGGRTGGIQSRGMEQIGGAPGVYDTPPLAGQPPLSTGAGYDSGAPLTPTPTPVAPLGEQETRQFPVKPMSTQEVAAYRTPQDPAYDPTEGASGSALPSAGKDQMDNPLFEEQQQQDISGTAYDQVETAPGQKDITHRGEQIGTPHFATHPQQTSAFASAAAEAPPQPSYQGLSSRLGASRRPVRTVNLANIGLPAPMPQRGETYAAPAPPKPEELGAADVLPQDEHYAKATAYDELGANARSALSGAGWKSSWANEMEASAQRGSAQALKYPVGPVVPKGASGFAPQSSEAIVGEPDYAALARGEPGFTVPGADLQDTPPLGPTGSSAVANLPPSVTGATSGLNGEVAPQPSYMQMAAPPVHPGAPMVDRGFTGPGGAAGGARRRLASKLFERQHSLQDPSFDPVSQRFGRDEGYGVELPVHGPAHVPTGRASTGPGSAQVGGASRGVSRASSQAGYGGMQPQYQEEDVIHEEEQIQEEAVVVVDKSKEMNERLLLEVRRRLQAAKSQLNTAPASEADMGTPVDSPLGGRPTVLQGRGHSGTPGQYWRTLEEVEAEGSAPMGRDAPSPWVQTRGPEMAPKRLFESRGVSSGFSGAPYMRTGSVPMSAGKVANKGLEGYRAGRAHNIAGGYPNRRSRGGNQYSWGREGVF